MHNFFQRYGRLAPLIFKDALKRVILNVENDWMVGDHIDIDVIGANQGNITSIWVNRDNETENKRSNL